MTRRRAALISTERVEEVRARIGDLYPPIRIQAEAKDAKSTSEVGAATKPAADHGKEH